jgi:predicted protein tyrosine phosphatase
MLFCDSFSILGPTDNVTRGKQIALSLWLVTQNPLRSSIRSLSCDALASIDELKDNSLLAVFSYLPADVRTGAAEVFNFPIKQFSSAFDPAGFLAPVNLPGNIGFCFMLSGTDSSSLSRSRCISLVRVIGMRPLQGQIVRKSQPLFDLFPCLSRLSLRFPLRPPPHVPTSFLSFQPSFDPLPSTHKETALLWEKSDKLERWRWHLSPITASLFISSSDVASNGDLLRESDVTHIVSCVSQLVESAPGFHQLNIPMNDGGDENLLSNVFKATVFIGNALASNGKVLVHCIEGVSRSVAIVMGYFVLTERIDYQTAYKKLRAARRVASPNPKFIAQLLQLAELVGATSTTTCYFSRNRSLPFEIIEKRNALVAVPVYSEPPENDGTKCYVRASYPDVDSLSKDDEKPPGIVRLDIGDSVGSEVRGFAVDFVGHLCACLRLTLVDT